MSKRTVRLTESDLKRVIAESVKKVLKEDYFGDAIYSYEDRTTMRAAQGMANILRKASDPSQVRGKNPASITYWTLYDIMHELNIYLPAIANCNNEEFWNLFPENSPVRDKKWWRKFLQKLQGISNDIADLELVSRQVNNTKFSNIIYQLTKDEE